MSYEIAKYQDNIGYAGTIIYRKTGTKPCNACLRNLSAEAGNDATYDKSGIHAYCLFLSVRRRWSAEQPKVESFRVLEFTNGDTYEGETLGDLRHGKGKHTCSNGDTHEGGWYKGLRHGYGHATFSRGFSYEGDFANDHASGSGKAKYENGGIYDGEFENDKRHGWGSHCFPDESLYIGEWTDDKIHGNGRLTQPDGSYCEGSWKEGSRIHGRWVSADKRQEYLGDWLQDKKHGQGTLHMKGLLQYTGSWQNDLQHGQGKCRWTDGSMYDGAWREGRREGKGKLVNSDDHKYDGMWQDDQPHGEGNARFADGDRYTGLFVRGRPHGKGRSVSSEGHKYSGDWEDGKRQGQGRCLFANGDKYQGAWTDGKRHGQGICHFADGRLFRGEWQEDSWLQSEAEPALCRVRGPGTAQATSGNETTLTISAQDGEGNDRLSGGDIFLVWLEGPGVVYAEVTDKGNGTYTAAYNASVAGMYELFITNDTGEAVAESPYPLRVIANKPAARKSTIRISSPSSAVVGQPVEFEVHARDTYGNRCYQADLPAELPLEVSLSGGGKECAVESTPRRGGSFSCSFLPKQPGFYRLNVSSNDTSLSNSPVSILVRSSETDAFPFSSDQKLVDRVVEWEAKAAEQYKEDGIADGWDSDISEPENAEQRYIREHPDVPVVGDLRDMWKVTKLQRERKAKLEKEQAMKELEALKSASDAQEALPEEAAIA